MSKTGSPSVCATGLGALSLFSTKKKKINIQIKMRMLIRPLLSPFQGVGRRGWNARIASSWCWFLA